jgi:hypothetical protein
MFDFLNDKTTEDVLAATYFAVRLITHRKSIKNYLKSAPVKGVSSEPSPEQANLGRKILHEILEHERTDMKGLSAAAASNYISELWKLVEEQVSRETGTAGASKAERVLRKWRASTRTAPAKA